MTIALLNPIRLVQTLIKNQKDKAKENQRRAALFRARDAFQHFGYSLDELTDKEVEMLVRSAGAIAREMESRKETAISELLQSVSGVIG